MRFRADGVALGLNPMGLMGQFRMDLDNDLEQAAALVDAIQLSKMGFEILDPMHHAGMRGRLQMAMNRQP